MGDSRKGTSGGTGGLDNAGMGREIESKKKERPRDLGGPSSGRSSHSWQGEEPSVLRAGHNPFTNLDLYSGDLLALTEIECETRK